MIPQTRTNAQNISQIRLGRTTRLRDILRIFLRIEGMSIGKNIHVSKIILAQYGPCFCCGVWTCPRPWEDVRQLRRSVPGRRHGAHLEQVECSSPFVHWNREHR